MKPDISKFNFAEAHNDRNGKSSNSKMNGTIIVWTGCLVFIISGIAVAIKSPEAGTVATLAAGVITVGATLSGYSKKKGVLTENKIEEQ